MPNTIDDIQLDAVYLAGMIGGAEVLSEQACDGAEEDPLTRLANNSLPAIFHDMRKRAEAIANALEELEGKSGEAA